MAAVLNGCLVFLEQRGGSLKKASLEVWNRVQALTARMQPEACVYGLIIGSACTRSLPAVLSGSGTVFHASSPGLSLYHAGRYARIVSDTFRAKGCSALYFADTALSRDLAPRLSVLLGASLLTGCSGSGGESAGSCIRSVYSGSVTAMLTAELDKRIYSYSFSEQLSDGIPPGNIVLVPLDDCSSEDSHPSAIVRSIAVMAGKPDVAEAQVVVAGGRGMGNPEAFAMLDELASLFGGAVGASRSVVDEGWMPHASQIGQTGKSVAPRLYIACGISGSVQHLAGISRAGTVVAINSDRHAPIFQRADFGVVGDVHTVIPDLIREVRDFLKKK
jgi:electron transfer flavoprotein alpha subunit